MKISKREQLLLGMLAAVFIVVLYYQFVYVKQVDEIKSLKTEKQEVQEQYDVIMETIKTLEERKGKIKIYNAGITDKMKLYYPAIVQEYIILEIDKMLQESGINGTISFSQITAATVDVIAPTTVNKAESSLQDIVDEYNNYFKDEKNDEVIEPQEGENLENQEANIEVVDEANTEDKTVAYTDATTEQIVVNLNFTGTYENLKKFLDIVDSQEKKLVITNITLSQANDQNVSGSLSMEFYGIPKLNDEDSSYFDWTLDNPSGKDSLFSTGGVSNTTIESATSQKNEYDFIMLAKSVNSDLPTVMLGTANDTSNLSYIYADNKGIEDVELTLTKVGNEYYYKYKTSVGSYPANYNLTGEVFIPVKDEIIFEIVSQSRVDDNDVAGVNLKVINNTDKNVNIVVSGEDSARPRVTIESEGSSAVKVTSK